MPSVKFPNTDEYIPFTPEELLKIGYETPLSMEDMRLSSGADFWGLFVANPDGSVKKSLYNTYDDTDKSQDAYRSSIWEDFTIATKEVGLGESLVLHMFQRDGYCLIAHRGAEHWMITAKRSPKY